MLRRMASLAGAVLLAVAGLAGSQLLAFMQQYAQRLAGHLDEARRQLVQAQDGSGVFAGVAVDVRQTVAEAMMLRVEGLTAAMDGLDQAGPWQRPFVFIQNLDWSIAAGTASDFTPALPLDTTSLVYGATAIIVVWSVLQLAGAALRRRRA
ncbi:MAG: DUF2937 family protein [Alphaproteobacteria bacterium]